MFSKTDQQYFQDSSEVKARIMQAARELFLTHGYKGTSVRDIATAADTNVAMVNYYYRSKYNLFEIIFEEALDALFRRIISTMNADLPFFELLEAWIDSYYDVLMEYPHIPMFLMNEVTLDPERLTTRLRNHEPHIIFESVSQRISEEVEKGTIRNTPPLDFMLNVLSLSIFPFIFANLAKPLADVSPEEYDIMLKGHKAYVVSFVIQALKPGA